MDGILTTGQKWAEAEARGDAGTLETLTTEDFHVVGPVGFVLDRKQYFGSPTCSSGRPAAGGVAHAHYSPIGGPPPFAR